MNDFPLESLRKLLDYTYSNEEQDFNETFIKADKDNHIFHDIERLSVWEKKTRGKIDL